MVRQETVEREAEQRGLMAPAEAVETLSTWRQSVGRWDLPKAVEEAVEVLTAFNVHQCGETCPCWREGFEAGKEHARDTVGDWYEPRPFGR